MFFKRRPAASVLTTLVAVAGLATALPADASRLRLRNTAPTISGTPALTVQATQAYAFQPTAKDAEQATLTFRIAGKPAWAAFSTRTGALTGTPSATAVGSYPNIVISVSDGQYTRSLPAFCITVTAPPAPVNHPPTLSGSPPTAATAGQPYAFQATGSDPDGQTLRYGIANRPSWSGFDTVTGVLSGTPGQADVGQYANIVISVSDGAASATLPAFAITVMAPTSGNATLSWVAPTQNVDGTPLTNLAGYRVRYGNSPTGLTNVLAIPGGAITSVVIEGLGSGTWYFTVAAYTTTSVESVPSNAVSKTIS
ncbi:MAG: putative Ig domain-containing protein [Steroidobacteraceae bacterium]